MTLKDKYYTVSEVAKLFRITRQTVYRLVKSGDIKAEKIGREMIISKAEYNRFIEERTMAEGLNRIKYWTMETITKVIRKRFNYSEKDKIVYIDFDKRNKFIFRIDKEDGKCEEILFFIGKVKLIDETDNETFIKYGYEIPIINIEKKSCDNK